MENETKRLSDADLAALAELFTARRHGLGNLDQMALFQEVRLARASESAALALNAELMEALEGAESILWMAAEYAAAGGSGGPEQRDFSAVSPKVRAVLARARRSASEGGAGT